MIAAFGVDSQDTPVMAQTHTKKPASNILTLPEWSVVDHNQELFDERSRRRPATFMRVRWRFIYERWLSFSCRLGSIERVARVCRTTLRKNSFLRNILRSRTAILRKRKKGSQSSHAAYLAT